MKFIFDEKDNRLYKLESADSVEYKIENNKFWFSMYKLFLNGTGNFRDYSYDSIFMNAYDIGQKDHEEFLENFEIDFFYFINSDKNIFNLGEEIKKLL